MPFLCLLLQLLLHLDVKAIVITGKGRAFIAGADISEFGGAGEGHSLNDVFKKIEFSTKPVVAAINGLALGGGLETALCCNYRIASKEAFVGLPEAQQRLLWKLFCSYSRERSLNLLLVLSH